MPISLDKKSTMTLREYKTLENIKTLGELAKRLRVGGGINPAKLVHNWITGKYSPNKKNLHTIMKATNGKVTPNDFLTQ